MLQSSRLSRVSDGQGGEPSGWLCQRGGWRGMGLRARGAVERRAERRRRRHLLLRVLPGKGTRAGHLCGASEGGIPPDGPVVPCDGRECAADGWLLLHILEDIAAISRDIELGDVVDGQLPGDAGGVIRYRKRDGAHQAVRISHHAEHDLQSVLSGGRRLFEEKGHCRFPEAGDVQQCRRYRGWRPS